MALAVVLFGIGLFWLWSANTIADEMPAANAVEATTVQAPHDAPAPTAEPVDAQRATRQAPSANATPGATKPFAFDASEPAAQGASQCAFPTLAVAKEGTPARFKVYAAGAYSGRPLGMHIDGRGHEAGRIDVAVNQPGETVALMLGSYDPTIWHIGWTKGTRIAAVLIGGYHRQVVTGLPKDVPVIVSTYEEKGPCGHFYVTAEKAPSLNPIARRAFGRQIDMVYPASDGRVLIGGPLQNSGALVTDASEQPDTAFQVAPARAGGEAGLAHAVSQGWLREARPSDSQAWLAAQAALPSADVPPIAGGRPAGELRAHNAYVVLKSFELPDGLYGAHSATFFVPKGVKRPTGKLGHSTLYDFNTMTCVGAICGMQ